MGEPALTKKRHKPRSYRGTMAGLTLGAAVSIGAAVYSDEIVDKLYPFPEIPAAPKPTPVQDISRSPIEIVVAFDRTRSAIIKQLPGVVLQTATFFNGTDKLRKDDVVTIYTFAETAQGDSFRFEDKSNLLAAINSVKTEGPRAGMETWVHASIEQIARETQINLKGKNQENNKPGIAIIWTDGIDDKKGEQQPLPSNHVPVKILVPERADIAHADKVKKTLGSNQVEVILANTEGAFGKVLEDEVAALNTEAENSTNRLRKAAKKNAEAADAIAKAKWQIEVGRIKQSKKKLNSTIDTVKTGIKAALGGAAFLCAAVVVLILRMKSLPRLKGYLVYMVAGEHLPTVAGLPRTTGKIRLNRYVPDESKFIEPAKKRVKVGNCVLNNGDEVVPGSKCFWFMEEPTDSEIRDLFKN